MVRQIDYSQPQPAQRFHPEVFCGWLAKQQGIAERVVVCYEAGCFGYERARRMQAMGVEVYAIASQNWDEQGKGQVNDKHDAQVMCRRLSEYLGGHRKASSPARKKAIVALARQLAVDLWRMATGRVQAQELGLVTRVRPN